MHNYPHYKFNCRDKAYYMTALGKFPEESWQPRLRNSLIRIQKETVHFQFTIDFVVLLIPTQVP